MGTLVIEPLKVPRHDRVIFDGLLQFVWIRHSAANDRIGVNQAVDTVRESPRIGLASQGRIAFALT